MTALDRLLLGSVSHRVLTHATCGVRVARKKAGRKAGPARVLIAVDGSQEAEAAAAAMAARAWKANTSFRVVIVSGYTPAPVDMPGMMTGPTFPLEWKKGFRRLADRAVEILARKGRRAEPVVREGDPREKILAEARTFRADTVFIASHAHGALRRFLLGSTSLSVAEHAACSVEIVRSR